jgi:hypothetical protein
MHSADELEVLRRAYADALNEYEAISSSLSRHVLAGTTPSGEELEREQGARSALDSARRRFLDAWKQSQRA